MSVRIAGVHAVASRSLAVRLPAADPGAIRREIGAAALAVAVVAQALFH
jgi:hypothetical protein